MLLCLLDMTVKVCQRHVVPAVDVDLFDVGIGKIFSQDGVVRHFGKEPFGECFGVVAFHGIGGIVEILADTVFKFLSSVLIRKDCRIVP